MNKADKYLKDTLQEILFSGEKDKDPRPRYKDGTPAHTKFITQQVFQYDISRGEYPITTLRNTALRAAFYDIEAIYIKQTNILEEMHPSIRNWWKDFIVKTLDKKRIHERWLEWAYFKKDSETYGDKMPEDFQQSSLGATYGATVLRYDLVNKLLKGLEENPFGRRHSVNLNQEQQKIDDLMALQPCAFETLWSVRGSEDIRFIDLTLVQRSMDFMMTASINPAQYVMLGMIVCNHLTFKTGIKHEVGKFLHLVQNVHIYDRHIEAIKEILERDPTGLKPKIELICKPKSFYSHTVEDFKFSGLEGIEKLTKELELAI